MAWSVTRTQFSAGNKRGVIVSMTADAATQTVEAGVGNIVGSAVNYKSCATGPNFIYTNSNASGVQSMGVLGCSGFTSGDEICVVVFGH